MWRVGGGGGRYPKTRYLMAQNGGFLVQDGGFFGIHHTFLYAKDSSPTGSTGAHLRTTQTFGCLQFC